VDNVAQAIKAACLGQLGFGFVYGGDHTETEP
jgi:hypothetical protein